MKKMIGFNEWLSEKDSQLYNELNMSDIASGAKAAWNTTGKVIGKTARNWGTAGLMGLGALGVGSMGTDPNLELVAKHNRMTVPQVQKMQQEDPEHYNVLSKIAQTRTKMHSLNADLDKGMARPARVEPKDGYDWSVPQSHYQSPEFDGGKGGKGTPKERSTKDVIDDIDSILGKTR